MAVLPLSDVFTARALGIAWNNYQATLGEPPYLGRSKFGTRKQEGLDLRFIKGSNSTPVSLKASNFDAQAPLRDGIGFSDIQNSMPFFRESYMVTEKEEQDYATYVSSVNEPYAKQILTQIMKKPMDLIRGARVVPERMIWQLLAPEDGIPKITVDVEGTTYTIDYTTDDGASYMETNFTEITDDTLKWNVPDTATPLSDLIEVKKNFAKNTGYSLTRFSMNTETFEMICEAEDTKKQVLGIIAYNGGIRLRQDDVTAYLAGFGIEIEVYDKIYIDEDGESQYFIPTGIVSAQSSGIYLGDFVFGTTPEERSGSVANGSLSVVDTGISVYTYATEHPVNTHCVVSMLGLPSYEGMDSVAVMKVV